MQPLARRPDRGPAVGRAGRGRDRPGRRRGWSAQASPSRGRGSRSRPAPPGRAEHPEWSVARRWDEALLDAIRRALPNPPVHARNLFHLSVAMWDAWAAYDPTATAYFVTEKHTRVDVAAARNEAISYAAYRVLTRPVHQGRRRRRVAVRVRRRHGLAVLSARRDHDRGRHAGGDRQPDRGDGPRRRPRRTARTRPTATPHPTTRRSTRRWSWPSPGTTMTDPNRWQPLQLEHMISQNGIPIDERRPAGGRAALGPRDGLRPAARPATRACRSIRARRRCSAATPRPTPRTRTQAVEVIRTAASSTRRSGRDDRHLARRRWAATRWARTTARARDVNPATGAAVPAGRRQAWATSPGC